MIGIPKKTRMRIHAINLDIKQWKKKATFLKVPRSLKWYNCFYAYHNSKINFKIEKFNTTPQTKAIHCLQRIIYVLISGI